MKDNRYSAIINLYKDWQITLWFDLFKQINHYTKEEKKDMYNICNKTLKDFFKIN